MSRHEVTFRGFAAIAMVLLAQVAGAQSFRVQCPTSTLTHPNAANNNTEPAYAVPTYTPAPSGGAADYTSGLTGPANGAIKCQQISGGDGYATMADGTQTYMFSFGPLSGLADIASGKPGTQYPSVFNTVANPAPVAGDPATSGSTFNGAIGLVGDVPFTANVFDASESGSTVEIVLNTAVQFHAGDQVVIAGVGAGYDGQFTVTTVGDPTIPTRFPGLDSTFGFFYQAGATGLAEVGPLLVGGTASSTPRLDGHVDPRQIMDVGVMNGNQPAPLIAIDEDDELFLTLTNVGMIMRPDLFEQHTVHFHGYPNASAFYDGVPDASVAINIGGSFTYYYLAPDAGTYFWHCHITPPEHLQMGMVGQLYVRPRQNRWSGYLYDGLVAQQADQRTKCDSNADILCSNPLPAGGASGQGASNDGTKKYAYNDGDGSTRYDVEYPLQMHGFDPNFHFVGMTFNPEGFADMKDKYFLLNGRGYPDTVTPGPMQTQAVDGVNRVSQPLPSIINIPQGKRALLRISSLDVSEYQTLASMGIPMRVIAYNAKLLRDQSGNNTSYLTNSITLGGGESLDVILDTAGIPKGTYFLYTSNLDHLSNDAENFGGLMTEVHVL